MPRHQSAGTHRKPAAQFTGIGPDRPPCPARHTMHRQAARCMPPLRGADIAPQKGRNSLPADNPLLARRGHSGRKDSQDIRFYNFALSCAIHSEIDQSPLARKCPELSSFAVSINSYPRLRLYGQIGGMSEGICGSPPRGSPLHLFAWTNPSSKQGT